MRIVIETGNNAVVVPISGVSWSRLRQMVKKRDKTICQYCGETAPDGHVDHIVPLSKGGTDSLDNLVWACAGCNLAKGSDIATPGVAEFEPGKIKRLLRLLLSSLVQPYPHKVFWGISEDELEEVKLAVKRLKSQRIRQAVRMWLYGSPPSWMDEQWFPALNEFPEGATFADVEAAE